MTSLDDGKNAYEEFAKGLWRDNPVFVAVLGMCPMLAVSNKAVYALAMAGTTMFVLVGSSVLVSLLRKFIPKQVRITTYVIIIATFVSVADLVLMALTPGVHKELGAFIALIVVNCLILGRQEAFASKSPVGLAVADAVGMSVGFTLALSMIGAVREVLGSGTLLGVTLFGERFEPWAIMVMPPGGFLTLGALLALFSWVKTRKITRRERAAGAVPAASAERRIA